MAAAGILLVDKPGGMTSHDVVARARRALGTRKIGHAGTLDPMATGLLMLGVEGATRLLTFIVGLDKTYEATIRLGVATDTDDAEGARRESGCRSPRRGHTGACRHRRREPHRAHLAGPQHGVGHQGRGPAGVRPGTRRRRGAAQGAGGDGVALRGAGTTARRRRRGPRCRGGLLERHLHPRTGARPRHRAGSRGTPDRAAQNPHRRIRRQRGGIRRRPGQGRARRPRACRHRGARPARRIGRRSPRPPPRQAARRRGCATHAEPHGRGGPRRNARRHRREARRRRQERDEHARGGRP